MFFAICTKRNKLDRRWLSLYLYSFLFFETILLIKWMTNVPHNQCAKVVLLIKWLLKERIGSMPTIYVSLFNNFRYYFYSYSYSQSNSNILVLFIPGIHIAINTHRDNSYIMWCEVHESQFYARITDHPKTCQHFSPKSPFFQLW